MKRDVIRHMGDFLNDFQYFKLEGYDVFHQPFSEGNKLVVLNITPYEDGLMLEVQLAITLHKLEDFIFGFYKQEFSKLSLSYWESLSQIVKDQHKRSFINNKIDLKKILAEIENSLVKKGFKWLDQLSDLNKFSQHLQQVIFSSNNKALNLLKLSQRSYLLRHMLGERITESVFYNYYEQLGLCKVPEHQLEEFLEFKSYLQSNFS